MNKNIIENSNNKTKGVSLMNTNIITETNNRMQIVNQVFNFKNTNLTVIHNQEDDSYYFIGKEVATALGYMDTDAAIRRHCEGTMDLPRMDSGQTRIVKIIPEDDMYSLVISSHKAEAKEFRKWITNDVLKSLRKTGTYSLPSAGEQLSEDVKIKNLSIDYFKKSLEFTSLIFGDSNVAMIAANKMVMRESNINLLELAGATSLIAAKQEAIYNPTEIEKLLGLKARTANKILIELGFQTKGNTSSNPYVLTESGKQYARYGEVSTNSSKSFQIMNIKWFETVIPIIKEYVYSSQ